ncbi:hypothetical protein EX30DRAFT_324874 [Ascodesmis nigricans]|uniref:Sulfate transporter family protein n=1 Tax=Ascodesmis nigricans TaxID=341454 RepID=A0A4S2MHD8_9PEZI|nr:hypothetical protein EX30DRAFT_324874 [Ascodesmis nigricans]
MSDSRHMRRPSHASDTDDEDDQSSTLHRTTSNNPYSISPSSPHRGNPIARSFYHSYRHGGIDNLLPPPSHHPSSVVRDETAELANLALNDTGKRAAVDSSSIYRGDSLPRQRRLSYPVGDFPRTSVSVSPDGGVGRASHLTRMFKQAPPSPSQTKKSQRRRESYSTLNLGEREPLLAGKGQTEEDEQYDSATPSSDTDLEHQTHQSIGKQLLKWPYKRGNAVINHFRGRRLWTMEEVWEKGVLDTATHIPAVFLGVLLNVLDGLSYGMILFPLGHEIFSDFGPDGLSMFYVSCVVSQLVYSLGGSAFKGGIGSEMIEVVPFFHQMAFTIMDIIGPDKPKSVVATTITSYAISSMLTGAVFFLLGAAKLGSLIGFFPRHILVGCIGGVGWFLVATGIEVSAQLPGNLNYNLETLAELFEPGTLILWLIPLLLAVLLIFLQRFIKSPMFMPLYFMAIPAVFYVIVVGFAGVDMSTLRAGNWVFEAPQAGVPFWHFYTLYDFRAVDWGALLQTVPAMFALTFFGILHVPINVPALSVSTGEDNVDVDRELIAHGISNALSGLAGSIQNYLVYSNSILFVRAGGNSRVAGVLLAIGTAGMMVSGPTVIGFIPIMVVGALIFLLGIELMKEALYDTWGKLSALEYLTICAIVITMGAWDFVIGILIGVVLACVSLVVQTSRKSAIRATFTGEVARSTVRRHPIQQRFLGEVGRQIYVIRLSGYMFFGTIASVEKFVRELLSEDSFSRQPIRFLILDLLHVNGMDFSAAEAFTRMKRLLIARGIQMILANIKPGSDVGKAMGGVGILQDEQVAFFDDLNSALESCENDLLRALYSHREVVSASEHRPVRALSYLSMSVEKKSGLFMLTALDVPQASSPDVGLTDHGSPRRNLLHQAATLTLKSDEVVQSSKWQSFKPPLPLILQIFQSMTDKNEDYWYRIVPYFSKQVFYEGTVVFRRGDPANEFYLVEDGVLRVEYDADPAQYTESIVAGTTCGELPFFSNTPRTGSMVAEKDTTAWVMDRDGWTLIQEKFPDVALELLKLAMKLTTERVQAVTKYMIVGT